MAPQPDQLELLATERRLVVRIRLAPVVRSGSAPGVKLELLNVAGDADCLPVDGLKLDRVWRGLQGSYGTVTDLANAGVGASTLRRELVRLGFRHEHQRRGRWWPPRDRVPARSPTKNPTSKV